MNSLLRSNQLKFFKCSNSACGVLFLINPKEVEHGNGIHFCPTCFPSHKTHHTIQCSNCLSIIDFLETEKNELVSTYYSRKCMCCTGTIDDEIEISKNNYSDIFAKS